jgi:D-alanyl-D-alanine carboxypeptidase
MKLLLITLLKIFSFQTQSADSLGISGTVTNLAKKSKAVGNVRAKSGSIYRISFL